MAADNRDPTPAPRWTLGALPIVVGWVDEQPLALAGPLTASDPWLTSTGWDTVQVVSCERPDGIERRGGREATLRRLVATARAHRWTWLPIATARADGSRHSLGIALRGVPRSRAIELGRGAGQTTIFELTATRLRIVDLVGGQVTTVRRHHHPRELMPPWLSSDSELLTVWRQRHRQALEPIGASPDWTSEVGPIEGAPGAHGPPPNRSDPANGRSSTRR